MNRLRQYLKEYHLTENKTPIRFQSLVWKGKIIVVIDYHADWDMNREKFHLLTYSL